MKLLNMFAAFSFLCAVACGGASVETSQSSSALPRGGGGGRLGYSCTNGTCICDKAIENDCENMTSVCTDATVDDVINCINGWLVTHCACTELAVKTVPKGPRLPTTGGTLSRN